MNTCRSVFIVVLLSLLPLTSFDTNGAELPPKEKFVVVLDAGHGGHDPGNLGNGYLEKNIALQIVLRAGEELQKHPNIKVVYTRKNDSFVDLYVRGKIANEASADLFVSVHCDSHTSDAHGAGTFVLGLHANRQNFEVAKKENSVIYLESDYEQRYAQYDINSPESVIGLTIMQEEFLQQSIYLGKKLQDNFTKNLRRKDRKVKQAGFIVLHQTFMPSVLVEAGFLTNKNEGSYLNSSKGQQEMGKAIAKAILTYKEEIGTGAVPEELLKVVDDEQVALHIRKENGKDPSPSEERAVDVPNTAVWKKDTEENKSEVLPKPTEVLVYKVQIMASARDIPLTAANFNGLDLLSKEAFNDLFRYMYGNATTYEEAKLLKTTADAKGYTTSYIVAYKNGIRIALADALK